MKKRLLSLVLALAMVLTMIPEYAYAATGTASLGFRWASWDPETQKHVLPEGNSTPETELTASPGGSPVSFYFTDENGIELLYFDDIKVKSENVVTEETISDEEN